MTPGWIIRLMLPPIVALLLGPTPMRHPAQSRLAELREQFQSDHDAVHQAKNFSKLGEALLAEMREQANAGNVDAAKSTFHEYRDDLRRIVAALKATGRNAEKHPNGYKELEIYLRKTLRDIDQVIVLIPFDQRAPFDAVRHEIASTDEDLYHLLFPRQPETKKP